MSSPQTADFFHRARALSASALFVAAALAALGVFLDWVTIEPPVVIPAEQAFRLAPFNGIDAGDGWFVLGGAVVMALCAVLLVVRAAPSYAWYAFFASIVVGGIGIADYRGIETLFYEEMQRIGEPTPAAGLALVAAGGLLGLIASVAAIAASPGSTTRHNRSTG